MSVFTDPVRHEEWRVLVEMDAMGGVHFVFSRDALVEPVVRNDRLHLVGHDELEVPHVYVFRIE